MEKINTILGKYNKFKGDMLRTIDYPTKSSAIVTIVVQDDDGEDLNSIVITFNGITNSRILVDSVLSYLDMMSGITLLKENDLYGFAVGSCTAMTNINNSPLFIIASDVTIQEK